MKIAAAASYRAVPSMLIVAPSGSTNSVERREMPARTSAHSMVTGRVAVELAVENAEDPVFGEIKHQRYRDLYRKIMDWGKMQEEGAETPKEKSKSG